MVIWIHTLPEHDRGPARSLTELLRPKQIETKEYDWSPRPAPGVLLISRCDDSVFGFVRTASCGGGSRILVLARERTLLRGGVAWELLRAGASDVMVWDGLPESVEDVAGRFERWKAVDEILESAVVQENLIGKSPVWRHILRDVIEVAKFSSASVLVSGESGTGKELIARLIHTLDPRPRKGELIVLDCTTVVPELSGSEFFGHERGSFTGAVASRDGAFALANGGTLFLDEVGELPHTLQAELLRVVQEHTYKRVGSNTWQKAEFRLISASNRELRPDKNAKGFRPDLYYRITSWSCCLPPLRQRREDIPALAEYFVRSNWNDGKVPRIDEDVLDYLMAREYPGNIRELRQLVLRMVQRHTGHGPITTGDLSEDERPRNSTGKRCWLDEEFEHKVRSAVALGATMREISRAAEDLAVRSAVAEENGSWHRAAERLGVTDRALQLRRAAWRQQADRQRDNSDHPRKIEG
jgi:transcriptional regulator with GAF, ATPase, and Fis domain